MAYNEIEAGDKNWLSVLNGNFKQLYGNFEFHDWSKDGIVMHNGFNLCDGSGYRYLELPGGQKLVEIIIHSTLTSDNFHGGDWFTLPDLVRPESYQLHEVVISTYYTLQPSANTVWIANTATTPFDQGGWDYTLHTMYFSK